MSLRDPHQMRHPAGEALHRLLWRRCPAGDPPRVIPRYGVVRDTRKAAAQLYGGGQFAIPLVDLPYGSCVGFGHTYMPRRMAPGGGRRKPIRSRKKVARRRDERLASEGQRRIDTVPTACQRPRTSCRTHQEQSAWWCSGLVGEPSKPFRLLEVGNVIINHSRLDRGFCRSKRIPLS